MRDIASIGFFSIPGIWASRSRSVAGGMLPDAREISNAVHKYDGEDTGEDTPVSSTVSQMLWSWGQFLSHDIINTPEGMPKNLQKYVTFNN